MSRKIAKLFSFLLISQRERQSNSSTSQAMSANTMANAEGFRAGDNWAGLDRRLVRLDPARGG